MTVPLIVLAVLSTVGGFIGVPYALSSLVADKDINVLEHTLEPVVAHMPAGAHGVTDSHGERASRTHVRTERGSAGFGTHAPAASEAALTRLIRRKRFRQSGCLRLSQ